MEHTAQKAAYLTGNLEARVYDSGYSEEKMDETATELNKVLLEALASEDESDNLLPDGNCEQDFFILPLSSSCQN